MKRCLIVTGGSMSHSFLKKQIENQAYTWVIGVDRGNEALVSLGQLPDIALGDMDSVSQETLQTLKASDSVSIYTYNPIKDATDTAIALEEAMTLGATDVDLLGATGSRLDHMFSTILLLEAYIGKMEIHVKDWHNDLVYLEGPLVGYHIDQATYDYFSLVAISEVVKDVTYEYAKYPLNMALVKRDSSLGVSNEWATDQSVTLSVSSGQFLLIRSCD